MLNIFKKLFKTTEAVNDNIGFQLKLMELEKLMLTSANKLTNENDNKLIISLTTYSKRIHDVYKVIESIGLQTLKPYKIILWLDEEEFSLNTLPLSLKRQIERGLEVEFFRNIKSYKKIIPSLKKYPEYNIITIDDDIIYPSDMIEVLSLNNSKYPKDIIGWRAHEVLFKNGKVLPYNKWRHNVLKVIDSDNTFITTGGGTLFPSNSISNKYLNVDDIMNLSPNSDDIWVYVISKLTGIKNRRVDEERSFSELFYVIPNGQDISLYLDNLSNHGNDIALSNLVKHYDIELC